MGFKGNIFGTISCNVAIIAQQMCPALPPFGVSDGCECASGGGTFIRLVEQGHLVEVAYQTSGSIAVSDEEALRFSEFASQYQATLGFPSSDSAGALSRIRDFFRNKRPGQVI
jgi:hypothetical protein